MKTLCIAAIEAYTSALGGFGGTTPPLLSEASPASLFSWMSANFSKLPSFVGKVGDFAMLSSATNFAKTLAKAGCGHIEEMKRKKDYESPAHSGHPQRPLQPPYATSWSISGASLVMKMLGPWRRLAVLRFVCFGFIVFAATFAMDVIVCWVFHRNQRIQRLTM